MLTDRISSTECMIISIEHLCANNRSPYLVASCWHNHRWLSNSFVETISSTRLESNCMFFRHFSSRSLWDDLTRLKTTGSHKSTSRFAHAILSSGSESYNCYIRTYKHSKTNEIHGHLWRREPRHIYKYIEIYDVI